ncbi:MAG TPA: hypothetical protein VGS08_04990 [Candidatus Saccharimonadales bacterium]|nr:hypothetical protein [Candidatus Saccharimonadales bacterium]
MKIYQATTDPHPGTDFEEVYPPARKLYNQIKAQTKRQPYIRSAYFGKEKIFIELFWVHLNQQNRKQRNKRLKFYGCGMKLIRKTKQEPITKRNPNKSNELLHRFAGMTKSGDLFYVQVKENLKTKRKDLMSIFPAG